MWRGPASSVGLCPGGRERQGLRTEGGGVAVEVALVLPMLCLLVIGGWVLGYMAFAKVALTLAANRAARDFAAATALYGALEELNRAYRYDGGFAESFGLPRWAVHALIMRTPAGSGKGVSDQAVVVATCYRLPLTIPAGSSGGTRQVAAAGLLESAERAWAAVQSERAEWVQLVQEARALYERVGRLAGKAGWVADLWRQAMQGPPADFTPYGARDVSGPDDLEQAVRELCEPPEALRGGSLIMTGRAAYLLQTVFEP